MATWCSYECAEACAEHAGSGTILDLRRDDDVPPRVDCPVCGHPMTFRACWPASEAGYGSRGDIDPALAAAAIDLVPRVRRLLVAADPPAIIAAMNALHDTVEQIDRVEIAVRGMIAAPADYPPVATQGTKP